MAVVKIDNINNTMINSKLLLVITFISICIVYYIIFPVEKILLLIKDEYILYGIIFVLFIIFQYFKIALKDKLLYQFIPNLNYVNIKSSVLFFLFFEAIDYYSEDGFKGMISLWFTYWLYGVLAYFLTHNINLYKNYNAYKKANV